ncbi:MAG: hypothetical protein GKC53_01325 [Neisseriaceae bacterium]|nr:MAG: hypothetical protein GKC53_01325 [Neisseriaceae bacterium]
MKKFFIHILLLVMSSLVIADPVKVSDVTIAQSIRNILGPDIKINYIKFKIDQNIDLKEKTGHINLYLYPETATVKPFLFEGIIKGKENLDVANHKLIVFKSNKVDFTDDNKISKISGLLTVRNRTVPLHFKITSFICQGESGDRTCDISSNAALDRTQLGITYGTKIGLSKQAPITVKLKLKE